MGHASLSFQFVVTPLGNAFSCHYTVANAYLTLNLMRLTFKSCLLINARPLKCPDFADSSEATILTWRCLSWLLIGWAPAHLPGSQSQALLRARHRGGPVERSKSARVAVNCRPKGLFNWNSKFQLKGRCRPSVIKCRPRIAIELPSFFPCNSVDCTSETQLVGLLASKLDTFCFAKCNYLNWYG